MDADRFDRLISALTKHRSRRVTLAGLAAAALGRLLVSPTAAVCKRRGKPCGDGQGRCCGTDLKCCKPAGGGAGTCRNLQKDRKHCGACGEVCGAKSGRPFCVAGECTAKQSTGEACPADASPCRQFIQCAPDPTVDSCACEIADDGIAFCGGSASCFPNNQCQEDADCFQDGIGSRNNPPGTRCIHRPQIDFCTDCASHCVLPCGTSVG